MGTGILVGVWIKEGVLKADGLVGRDTDLVAGVDIVEVVMGGGGMNFLGTYCLFFIVLVGAFFTD